MFCAEKEHGIQRQIAEGAAQHVSHDDQPNLFERNRGVGGEPAGAEQQMFFGIKTDKQHRASRPAFRV